MASLSTVLALITAAVAVTMGVLNLEKIKHNAEFVEYQSITRFHESIAWDSDGNRFLVSGFDGSISEIKDNREVRVLKDEAYAGNATLGLKIDRQRNRLVVAIADLIGLRYGAVAAYDLRTWKRLFLTPLSGSGTEKTLADDVAVDADGNVYVTDAKRNKIWKLGPDGAELAVISDVAFTSAKNRLPFKVCGLNGVLWHPDGYLLVIHSWAGVLFKVNPDSKQVKMVNMSSLLLMGDSVALLSPDTLVVAGALPSARLVQSSDGWLTARLTHRYVGPLHRIATSATIKNGKVYVSHLLGWKHHLITEAVFNPVAPSS
eukprot:TRINITY_DN7178_c0_g1_i1.p1 TRINITY_DN7178_c0_g1~~TRINITY_DN7178_c0_g1_i1.p1  ORF type:complete len:317 (-),score=-9.36 TRINITY_DN7178_c0_g1_i1:381-1331(-)